MKSFLFTIFILICLCNIEGISGRKFKKDEPKKKAANSVIPPDLIPNLQGLLSSFATGDRVETMRVLTNLALTDPKMNKLFKILLRLHRKVLDMIHPIYLKLFPNKKSSGDFVKDFTSGASGFMGKMKAASKLAQAFGASILTAQSS